MYSIGLFISKLLVFQILMILMMMKIFNIQGSNHEKTIHKLLDSHY